MRSVDLGESTMESHRLEKSYKAVGLTDAGYNVMMEEMNTPWSRPVGPSERDLSKS